MEAKLYASLEEAISGSEIPREVHTQLALVAVPYLSFDGTARQGQLVVNIKIAEEIQELFSKLVKAKFPIDKIVPIKAYNFDDTRSMTDNNTSAFNHRTIIGTDRLSNQSYGLAIDINPLQNPYYAYDGNVYPQRATYDPSEVGTITTDSEIVRIFKSFGWTWLGEREVNKDYQHFEKNI